MSEWTAKEKASESVVTRPGGEGGEGGEQSRPQPVLKIKRADVEGELKKKAAKGESGALAFTSSQLEDKKKAAELYRQAHEAGSVDATHSLGTMYRNGEGVRQDKKKAADLYRQAHEAGNTEATYALGLMYENGDGLKQNKRKADTLYRQAHDSGAILKKRRT